MPFGHAIFLAAYAWLARTPHPVALRRCFAGDQVLSIGLLVGLAALLLVLRDHADWRGWVGAWYVLFIGTKTAFFLRAVWVWLAGVGPVPVAQPWRCSSAPSSPTSPSART